MTTSTIVVRYAETDQMGIVHHAVYPVWMEQARTEWIATMGIQYKDMEAMGIFMPIHSIALRYFNGALYEDVVTIAVRMTKITPSRIELAYTMTKEVEGETVLLTTAQTTNAFTSKDLKPINMKKAFPELYHQLEQRLDKE